MVETAKYYQAKGNEQLDTTARKAVALAAEFNMPVHIKHKFNTARDVPDGYQPVYVTITPESTTSDVKQAILDATQQQLAPVKDLVTNLLDKAIAQGLTAVVQWVRDYADAITDGRDFMPAEACRRLKAAGYEAGEFLGAGYDKENKNIVGRFIVSQLVGNLEDAIPPHQIVASWADDYLEMRDTPPVKVRKAQPKI